MSPPPPQSSLPAGWLGLYREGVKPSGPLQKVSDQKSHPPFLDLSWRKGSFMAFPLTCGGGRPDLVRFRAGAFDHLGPLLGLACEKLGEIGGRAGQRRATQLGNPLLHLR